MKKIMAIAIILGLAMSVGAPSSFAIPEKKLKPMAIVNVGNKTCPVSGDKVSGKDFVVYKGKSYGLCCPMCEGPFLKEPEKYIAAMKKGEPAAGMKMMMPAPAKSEVKAKAPASPAKATSDKIKSKAMEKAMEQGDL